MRKSLRLWIINVAGGVAVLGSYAYGILTHKEPAATLWNGIPPSLKPFYNVSMLAATAGYFLFVPYIFWRRDPNMKIGGRDPEPTFAALFALILGASALWMPLTFRHAADPTPAQWAAIRGVLGVVGAASVGLVIALLRAEPKTPTLSHRLAVLGAVLFAFQTGVLDAIVWTKYWQPPTP